MTAIDSLLNILMQLGGTELKLGSDRRPQMFTEDAELPLTMPAMSEDGIRELLGDLWTSHAAALKEQGELRLPYRSTELGTFAVRLSRLDDSRLEVAFRRDGVRPRPPDPPATNAPRARAEIDAASAESGLETDQLPPSLITLLARAVSAGASDLHLSPQQAPIVRINGTLRVLEGEPSFDTAALLDSRPRLQRITDGVSVDRAVDVPGVGRVRVNVYASAEGLCAAVRILRTDVPSLSDLNLPPQLEPLVDFPHGLVIICGPAGSGKSTTLAALVQRALRAEPQVVVTLEDPIEYVIRPMRSAGLVRQREVGTHVRDFATGLRDALREDPDILLIGEMRDPETISLALTAAETGQLVFASLHSRTAPSAVERIVDAYPPERQRQIRVQLADALRAVISQRLLPTADGTGRLPAVELLRVTHGVANLIRDGRTAQIVNALQSGGNDGMLVLERSLTDLVRAKRVRREDAIAAANDVNTLGEYLRAAGS